MKNIKKKELLYNAMSDLDADSVSDFINYENALPGKAEKTGTYHPVPRIIGAFVLLAVVCGGTFAGLKYLEYKGGAISGLPETTAAAVTETPVEDDEKASFRLVKELKSFSGYKLETVYEYDEHGRVSKETAETQIGGKEITEYIYNERGDLITKNTEELKPLNNMKISTETVKYCYSDGKHLSSISSVKTEKTGTTEQTTKTETRYGYNDNWQIVRYEYDYYTTSGDNAGKMHYYTDYTFTDENGSYTYIQKSDSGEITTGEVTLDKIGNVIKSVTEINGEVTVMETEYDEHGKITKSSRDGKVISESSHTYNGDVLIRADVTLHNADGEQKTYNLYRYDEYGNVKEFSSYTKDGNLIEKITYEWEPVYDQ